MACWGRLAQARYRFFPMFERLLVGMGFALAGGHKGGCMQHAHQRHEESTQDIDQLNSFLRGELAAVATYEQALSGINKLGLRATLISLRQSHQMRSELIQRLILKLGGIPSTSSGAWGAFATTVEGGATSLGETAVIATLEEGEDHGENDYRRDISKLSAPVRRFVESELIPAQKQTHDIMRAVKHRKD